jgi:crotonobetainyl-CoA:carnitine CoA-transferase CaiB-like acyl-CoA transferase
VAVTAADDQQWSALASVVGIDDSRFSTLTGRLAHHDDLDTLISAWTASRTPAEVTSVFQEAGVPAYEVLDNIGVLHDPQVRDRGWFEFVPSARFPDGDVFSGHPIRLSDTPGAWWRAGPSLGEDTADVLTRLGGFSSEDVDAFCATGGVFGAAEPDRTLRRPYIDYVNILGVQRTAP